MSALWVCFDTHPLNVGVDTGTSNYQFASDGTWSGPLMSLGVAGGWASLPWVDWCARARLAQPRGLQP